jgi:hypothetical protein
MLMNADDTTAGEPSVATPLPPAVFEQQASRRPPGLLAEYWSFLRHNKKWWLTPIVVAVLAAGLLVFLAGTVGPFIYPGL